MKSSRLIAFETLHKIFYDSTYSNLAVDNALKDVDKDKAFISALVYGVVERKITLDYYINKYLTAKPKPKIMTVLRLGAYQLLFMDKVPSSAAINESVKLTRDIKQDYYSKLVNAVLHKIDSNREELDNPSIKYSVPECLINMWNKQYGADTVSEFLPALNERPPIYAIPNRQFVDAGELCYELLEEGVDCEVLEEVVLIHSSIDFNSSRAYKNGLFYIEDLSSYHCAKALQAKPGETVIDFCSAPGGKAFTIAQDMENNGRLYAFDLYEHRAELVKKSAERLELNVIISGVNDASVYSDTIPDADRILCDVPCSGFGIVRRKPEIRYKNLDSIKDLPEIQLNILKTSAMYLKDGGRIIYSTCTLNKKENEKVVSAFLNEHSGFSFEYDKTIFPSANGGDGFYFAVLTKNYD
mgnify:FL=1